MTGGAAIYIGEDKLGHIWPVIGTTDRLEGFDMAQVSSDNSIVDVEDDGTTEIDVYGDIEMTMIID